MAKRIAPKTRDDDKIETKLSRKIAERARNLQRNARRGEKYLVLSHLIQIER